MINPQRQRTKLGISALGSTSPAAPHPTGELMKSSSKSRIEESYPKMSVFNPSVQNRVCSLPCTRTHWKFAILGFLLIPFSWRSPLSAGTTDHPAAPGCTGTEIPQPLHKFRDKKMIPEHLFIQILPNLSILLFQLSSSKAAVTHPTLTRGDFTEFPWKSTWFVLAQAAASSWSSAAFLEFICLSYLKNFLSLGPLTTLFLFFNVTLTSHKKQFNKGRLCTPSETPTPVEIGMLGEMPSYTMSEVHFLVFFCYLTGHLIEPHQGNLFSGQFSICLSDQFHHDALKLKQITSI